MNMILAALIVMLVGGFGALLVRSIPKIANSLGLGGAVIGAVAGIVGAISVLLSPHAVNSLRVPWSVPFGSFYLAVDSLSAFFLIPVFLLTGLAALYGAQYIWTPQFKPMIASHWAYYNLLAASIVMVLVARNGVLFLVAWELMALASFFLVTMEHDKVSVQRAGWIYLASTHIGTTVLFFFFILLGTKAGSLDFDRIAAAGTQIHPHATLLFILALIGFGSKAGIVPLHVWLPEAHPAAPSHVSALMSGIMIKTGIYGIIRALMWLGPPSVSWATTLIVIGCVSGILGVLLALVQHNLKRLLAYHSVENIGIIFLGLGIGVLGQATRLPVLVVMGYGGALLHTLNHAIFKGLLFLGAGSVLHGAGTLDLEQTGGLFRRMPWTGIAFLTGAIAICGLPPLNGFVSEFMIYFGAFHAIQSNAALSALPAVVAIISLAMIGGLAAACFTKAFGIVFLGEPRSLQAAQAHESGAWMRWPMAALALLCLIIGLSAPLIPAMLEPVVTEITGFSLSSLPNLSKQIQSPLSLVLVVSLIFGGLIGALAWFRFFRLRGKSKSQTVTWDCGYATPTSRMQYTASSFAQPLMALSVGSMLLKKHIIKPLGFFPEDGSFNSENPDFVEGRFWKPSFKGVEWFLLRFRWMQTGSIHLYILYITVTLITLLIWKLW